MRTVFEAIARKSADLTRQQIVLDNRKIQIGNEALHALKQADPGLHGQVMDMYSGQTDLAAVFMMTAQPVLNNRTPVDCLAEAGGLDLVRATIGRLNAGVYI